MHGGCQPARFGVSRVGRLLLLKRPHLREETIRTQQFRVRAAFHDASVVHHDDLLRVDDRGKAVRNDERGALAGDGIAVAVDTHRIDTPGDPVWVGDFVNWLKLDTNSWLDPAHDVSTNMLSVGSRLRFQVGLGSSCTSAREITSQDVVNNVITPVAIPCFYTP